MYERGKGVKKNYKKAAELYKLASDQGDASGQASLGMLYRLGEGVVRDLNESVRLIRLSVAQKNDKGIFALSSLYAADNGLKKSGVLAYALVKRCGKSCNADQRIELYKVANIIREQDIEVGKNLYDDMIKRDDILSVVDEYEKTL